MNIIGKFHNIIIGYKKKRAYGAEAWVVQWDARNGHYYQDLNRVAKVFLSERDADAFAKSLRDAQELLQNTEQIHISVTRQK